MPLDTVTILIDCVNLVSYPNRNLVSLKMTAMKIVVIGSLDYLSKHLTVKLIEKAFD
jgi:hypothetical protein